MAEKQFEPFRIVLPADAAKKYRSIAERAGVSVPTILKIVLAEAAKKEIVIPFQNNA